MKFWNKQKHLREKSWTKVSLPRDPCISGYYYFQYDGWTRRREYEDQKRDLQLLSSKGKFYMTMSHKDIWFEKEKDAAMFILRWC